MGSVPVKVKGAIIEGNNVYGRNPGLGEGEMVIPHLKGSAEEVPVITEGLGLLKDQAGELRVGVRLAMDIQANASHRIISGTERKTSCDQFQTDCLPDFSLEGTGYYWCL